MEIYRGRVDPPPPLLWRQFIQVYRKKKLFKQQVDKSTGNVVSRFPQQKTKTSVSFTGDIFLRPIQVNIYIEMAYSRAKESDPEGAACFWPLGAGAAKMLLYRLLEDTIMVKKKHNNFTFCKLKTQLFYLLYSLAALHY